MYLYACYDSLVLETKVVRGPTRSFCQFITGNLQLGKISNRGVEVYPAGHSSTFCTNHWSCRFVGKELCEPKDIILLLQQFEALGLEVIKTENLYTLDGQAAFSAA